MQEVIKLPNKTSPDSPVGGEERNREIGVYGEKKEYDYPLLDHTEIGEKFDLFDFDSGSKITGSKFVYFKNEAALLELALCSWAMQKVASRGYAPLTTPEIVHSSLLEGCGFAP
jgi:seryl-tRNA synthetase